MAVEVNTQSTFVPDELSASQFENNHVHQYDSQPDHNLQYINSLVSIMLHMHSNLCLVCVRVRVCACMRACVRACMRACVVCVHEHVF